MLEDEASNSDSNDHDGLIQSSRKLGRPPKIASITIRKITIIASHGSTWKEFRLSSGISAKISLLEWKLWI